MGGARLALGGGDGVPCQQTEVLERRRRLQQAAAAAAVWTYRWAAAGDGSGRRRSCGGCRLGSGMAARGAAASGDRVCCCKTARPPARMPLHRREAAPTRGGTGALALQASPPPPVAPLRLVLPRDTDGSGGAGGGYARCDGLRCSGRPLAGAAAARRGGDEALEPDPARPGPVRPGSTRFDPTQPGSARFGRGGGQAAQAAEHSAAGVGAPRRCAGGRRGGVVGRWVVGPPAQQPAAPQVAACLCVCKARFLRTPCFSSSCSSSCSSDDNSNAHVPTHSPARRCLRSWG